MEHVLLVFHIELADTALIGVSADGIVRNTHSHPNYALAARTRAHHLHYPRLVRVADVECLAA